jgi:hypothetical protein
VTAAWATEAIERLQNGLPAEVRPRGHSMTGLISDGDLVTLEALLSHELAPGDVVLVRVPGKRYSHVVLHMVIGVDAGKFLIGSHQDRVDGWVDRADIYGFATSHGLKSAAGCPADKKQIQYEYIPCP